MTDDLTYFEERLLKLVHDYPDITVEDAALILQVRYQPFVNSDAVSLAADSLSKKRMISFEPSAPCRYTGDCYTSRMRLIKKVKK